MNTDSEILVESRRLHALGFAIHWLYPKDKRPIDTGWTTGPRKTWDALEKQYRPGMNMGVRLGTPSKLKTGFLYVVDCDVKSVDPIHQTEMETALTQLFPAFVRTPMVLSGRGNGSKHLYVYSRTPIQEKRLASSSARVGRKHAWEIVLMGEGRQVVLPPSIHPESGKAYKWGIPFRDVAEIPLIETDGLVSAAKERTSKSDFKFEVADVDVDRIPERILAKLQGEGMGVDDSALLYGVICALIKEGFTDNEIMTVLTDRLFELSDVAYRHRQTEDRTNAAHWLKTQNIDKARKKALDTEYFEKEVVVEVLGEAEQAEQQKEMVNGDWKSQLERVQNSDRLKVTLKNLTLIFDNALGAKIFKRNEFTNRDQYAINTPWNGKKDEEIKDIDILCVKKYLGERFRFEPANGMICDALRLAAHENSYHPVKDYLESLEWDGTPRLDDWLITHCGATREPRRYLRFIGPKILIAAVARIYEPGCKFDHVPIFEGTQGQKKSSLPSVLASKKWFLDNLPPLMDKDARINIYGNWFIEMPELVNMKHSDVETVKAFVAASSDQVRIPYDRFKATFLRQCIFIGSTNEKRYLKDRTGNRRFWPVTVEVDIEKVKRDRDQLFAEAKTRYDKGEKYWSDEKEDQEICAPVTNLRLTESDEETFRELIDEAIKSPEELFNFDRFLVTNLFNPGGPLGRFSNNRYNRESAKRALERLGFTYYQTKGNWYWKPRFCKNLPQKKSL